MYRSVINYGLASGMLIIGLGPTGAEAFVAKPRPLETAIVSASPIPVPNTLTSLHAAQLPLGNSAA